MSRIPCLDAVAQVLESEGVDTVFGTASAAGAAVPPLCAALRTFGIRHVTVRREAGGAYAADGWARATGKVGVTVGTSGPAGTNMITGLHTALADSIPLLCITGPGAHATPRQEARRAVDIVETARPVTKWAVRVTEPGQVPWVIREAFRIARSGRPGPVLVDLPLDVQRGFCSYDAGLDAALPVCLPEPRSEPVRAAVDMLLAARRPLILAGGGVIGGEAWEELRDLAEYLQVPVQVTLMGKGAFPEDHPLFAGMAGLQAYDGWGNAAFLESDLVLAVGTRFGGRHTGDLDTYRRGRTFIHVDIEPTQLGKVFEPDLGIVGHAKPTLAALDAHARHRAPRPGPGSWADRVAELRGTVPRPDDVPIKPPRASREINEVFGPDTTFVTATELCQLWSGPFQRTFRPRHHLVRGEDGPPGWEIPAAIGARCARPDEPVVAVVGDSSVQFQMEELAVAARNRIPLVIVMVDSECPGQAGVGYDMGDGGGGRGIDHVKLMDAFGCPARRVEQPGEIAGALRWAALEAEAAQLPVLVDVTHHRCWSSATSRITVSRPPSAGLSLPRRQARSSFTGRGSMPRTGRSSTPW